MIKKGFCLLLLVSICKLGWGADASLEWHTFETDHFLIHYPDTLQSLVDEVAAESERAHDLLSPYLKWQPEDKTQVVMVDDFDSPNGSATPIPNNTITLFMQPPTTGSLTDYDSWLRLLITHEYTHILHIDKALGLPDTLRNVFGRMLFLFPNLLHPNWFQEGFATFVETQKAEGIGRGQSDYFEMMMRQEVLTGLENIGDVNTVYSRAWPLNHAYLYGVYYMQFIADTYGEEALLKVIEDYSDNILPFRIDSNPAGATGKTLSQLWPEFQNYLHRKFSPQIRRIQSQSVNHTVPLVDEGVGYASPRIGLNQQIWFTGQDGYQGAQLYRYNGQSAESVLALNSVGEIDINTGGDLVISQLEICDNRKLYYDLYILRSEQAESDSPELERITKCGRYPFMRWHNQKLLAVKYDATVPQLVSLNQSGDLDAVLWQGNSGDVLGDFDVNEQGVVVAVLKPAAQGWNLHLLRNGEFVAVTNDGNIQRAPQWSNDELFFVQGGEGQFEAYSWNWNRQDSVFESKPQRLTNTLTGVQEAIPYAHNQLIITEYTSEGDRISSTFKNSDLAPLGQQTSVEFEAATAVQGDSRRYNPIPSLLPTWWVPVANVDEDRSEYGVYTFGNDAAGFHNYAAQITYESNYNYVFPNVSYSYDGRLLVNYNTSMKSLGTSSEGDDIATYQKDQSIAYLQPFAQIKEKAYLYGAYINSVTKIISSEDIERGFIVDGRYQSKVYDDWLAAGVIYDSRRSDVYQGDMSSGTLLQLNIESASAFDNDISEGEVTTFDGRWYAGFFGQRHTLAQRFVLGIGQDTTTDFELGGAFSDQSFGPTVNLNKRDFALRGYEEGTGALSNDNMALYSVEYRLPYNWDSRSIMSPPLGSLGSSFRIFSDVGTVWAEGESPERAYSSLGGEWVLDTTVGYFLLFQLHLGVARGFNEGGTNTIYVQMGGAF